MAIILTLATYRTKHSVTRDTGNVRDKAATILLFDGVWQERIAPDQIKPRLKVDELTAVGER